MSYEGWERAGRHIARVLDASAWCLGDWLVHGQDRYADRYRQAVATVGLDYQTLRNYAWVARKFELSHRRDQLSFQHHAEVASLPVQSQDQWLDRAQEAGWSKAELRRQIRSSRTAVATREATAPQLPRIHTSPERVQRWQEAAAHSDLALGEWVTRTLDQAADQTLNAGYSVGG